MLALADALLVSGFISLCVFCGGVSEREERGIIGAVVVPTDGRGDVVEQEVCGARTGERRAVASLTSAEIPLHLPFNRRRRAVK